MKNTIFRKNKFCVWALLLFICVGIVGNVLEPWIIFAKDSSVPVSRAEWLHELTTTFQMTVDTDNYPDNYFSDINSGSEYYYDVMLATEFGLIDVEAGEQFRPDEPATREFAARTLNLCLGYVLEEEKYTFNEVSGVKYPVDIQVAINESWFALNNDAFMPNQPITEAEKNAMVAFAKEKIASTQIDTEYNSKWTFNDGVIVLPDIAIIEKTAENEVTVKNCTVNIKNGDIFGFIIDNFPMAYKAENVSLSDTAVIIEVSDVDISVAFSSIDVEGTVRAELSQVQLYDDDMELSYIVGGTEEENYEDGEKYSLPEEVSEQEIEAVEIKKVYAIPDKIRQKYNIADGVEATITCKVSDVWYDYRSSFTDAYACVGGTVSFDCNVSADVLDEIGVPKKIELLRVPVWGNFIYMNATLDLTLKGDVTLSLVEYVQVGLEAGGGGCRLINSFHKQSFTIQASVEASVGVTANAVLDLMVLKGNLYTKVGAKVKAVSEHYDSGSPAQCTHINAYMYASAGGSIKVNLLVYKKEWSKEVVIYNADNSPVRLSFHYEDGIPVAVCTRDKSSSDVTSSGSAKYKYYTPINSKYGYNGASKGIGSDGQPYTIFEYKLNDEGNAVITTYNGNVSALSIPAVLDGYKVVEIGSGVFQNNTQLRVVVIPDSVTKIGDNAFNGCINISSIKLSKNVTSIGYDSFRNCDGLTSVEIPKSLKETTTGGIPSISSYEGIFTECDNLKTVTFEQGTTKIASYLFANCPGLERIEIPDTVIKIEQRAFYRCNNLKEVRLSSSVTELGKGAFERCTALTEIDIPNSVNSIESSVFSGCSSIHGITIPDSVTKIGDNAFNGCVNLSSVNLSKGVTSIGYDAFRNCDGLTSVEIPKSLKETTTGGIPSISSYEGIFTECDNLKTVTFEQGTTKIASYLFANCPGLERIEIPDTVIKIEQRAFYRCNNLKEVRLSSSVTELGKGAFERCTALTEIDIPNSINSIESSAFDGCSSLTYVKLPQNITDIGENFFRNCSSLKQVDVGGAVQRIGQYAFYNCKSLETILLPNTLTSIATNAFYDCDSLSTITIPDSVTSIGTYCFSNCEKLGEVQFGTGLTVIPSYAFDLCPSLTKVVLPYRMEKIQGNAFTNCTKLAEVTIPRTTTSIANNVFSYPAKMTIYGINGTYAQEYANANNIRFVNQQVNASAVSLNKTELKLNRGDSDTLVVSITPNNFTDSVTWKSSDTNIATISENGVVRGVAAGTATIRVNVGNVSATCIVNVVQPVTYVSLNKRTLTLGGNETFTLTASVGPDNAYDKTLEWNSSDETVACVDSNGTVVGRNKGTAVISVKAKDGSEKSASCTVTVTGSGYVAQSVDQLESSHNYENNSEDSWIYTLSGAKELSVTFDDRTNLENGFDYLYIYDNTGKEVGRYTGVELAGKTILVAGDTIKIRLVSDNAGTEWGFKVARITKNGETADAKGTEGFVNRLYSLVLGREADEGGFNSWCTSLKNHTSSGIDIGYGFVFSPECINRNLSNEDFVEMLYNTFMNRPSDEGGKSAWVSQLNAGVDREKVFQGFVLSVEFSQICDNYGISIGNVENVPAFADALTHYRNQNADLTKFVARCYTEALGRNYEIEGLESWCRAIIEQNNTPKQVAQMFIFSDEFVLKNLNNEEYVKVLYHTFMGREADAGGLAGWVEVLESGREDRMKVLEGFSDSVEFDGILKSFGLR